MIKWKDSYDLGLEKLDQEHRYLAALLNRLAKHASTPLVVAQVIDELLEYAECHFSGEEKYMKVICYNDIERHRMLHREFMVDLYRLRDYANTTKRDVFVETSSLLSNWLVEHVLNEDMKMKKAGRPAK